MPLGHQIDRLSIALESAVEGLYKVKDSIARLEKCLRRNDNSTAKFNLSAVDVASIVVPRRPKACLQCIAQGPSVTCLRVKSSVNCRQCGGPKHKKTCEEVRAVSLCVQGQSNVFRLIPPSGGRQIASYPNTMLPETCLTVSTRTRCMRSWRCVVRPLGNRLGPRKTL